MARKDAVMARRNKLLLLALFGGILFSLIYYALPAEVDDTYSIAYYDAGDSGMFEHLPPFASAGLAFEQVPSREALISRVNSGDYLAGVAVPDGFIADAMDGLRPPIELIAKSGTDAAVVDTVGYLVRTISDYAVFGTLPVVLPVEVIGEDTSGIQVPLRKQSVPFYVIMALMMEMWTIATLIIEETSAGTMRAVLVTPARPSDIITAKTLVGGLYTIGVVSVILVLTQSIRGDPAALVFGILLGALLAVSLGLLLGSLTKTITGSYIYVSVPMLVLILPGLVLLVPGLSHDAIRLIPTYYLVDALERVLNSGASLGDVWRQYATIAVLDTVFFCAGVLSLRRRYR
jgi:ABC-2 type transport system permease protein